MNHGKHSASRGKHTVAGHQTIKRPAAGKHAAPRKRQAGASRIAAAGLALALSAACVPVGISLAQPAQELHAGGAGTQIPENPESQEMTPAEKAAIDEIVEKYTLTTGEKAVKIARRYLGTPYVWGGAEPGGFDCSGLTSYVYARLGVDLAHFAQTQYGQGRAVSSSELEPGDLVFFGPSASAIGHVGFYVGGGKYLHAPKTGDVVKVSRLADRADYVGACRPY